MGNVWPKNCVTYLEWRCRVNWHTKYLRYVQEWIQNVTKEQMDYFINVEMKHLIQNGTYNP